LRSHHWLAVLRALALVALATSVALFIDYVTISPSFCGADSGCSVVRASGFGYVAGIPVPVFGVLGFAFLFALSLGRSPTARSLLTPVSYFAALLAVGLIGLQAKLGHFCSLCLIVDTSAVAIGIVAHLRASAQGSDDVPLLGMGAWLVLALAALGVPPLWWKVKPTPAVPVTISKLYQPGKINVVEFADFECPFCRMLHPTLKKLVGERVDKVNFVRLNMPLPRHPHALDAAKGGVCGEEQGKKNEMADQLFESEDLTPTAILRIAATLHLDMSKFKACIQSPDTEARIDREQKILRDAGFQGLPTTYIGEEMIVGAQDEVLFREAMDNAARGQSGGGVPAWLFAILVGAGVAATIRFGRPG